MRFDIITSFPEIFDSYLGASILKRTQKRGLISVKAHDLRSFSRDKRRTVDDAPFGGGAGMVLMAEPIVWAVSSIKYKVSRKAKPLVILLSAKGRQFNQKMAYDWAKKYDRLILISGRYEGIDERVKAIIHNTGYKILEVSIGPYVLTDGDVAAMAIISAVARLIPGVIKLDSLAEESHWNLLHKSEAKSIGTKKGLEYPHYTRPEVLHYKSKTYRVPKVLLSGNHRSIAAWRLRRSR